MSVTGLRVASSAFMLISRTKSCLGIPAVGARSIIRAGETSFSRNNCMSMWCAANFGPRSTILAGSKDDSHLWKNAGFCKLHTTGDHDLADFLKDEIKLEKDIEKKSGGLPKIKSFEVTKIDGPNVVLTRKLDHETITVKFNVNNSVEDSEPAMETAEQVEEAQGAQMVSKPEFVVEINKGGDNTLAIHCTFPHPNDTSPPSGQDDATQYETLLDIQDVALLNKSQEWSDNVFALSGSVMDGNLYDMLLKLLEERGVDDEFLEQVIDFSTSYEHKKYVELLENLKDFVESK